MIFAEAIETFLEFQVGSGRLESAHLKRKGTEAVNEFPGNEHEHTI